MSPLGEDGRRRAIRYAPERNFWMARPPAPPRLLPRPCTAASSRAWPVAYTTGRAVPPGFVLVPQALPTHRTALPQLCAPTNRHRSAALRLSTRLTRDTEHAHENAVELRDKHTPIRQMNAEIRPQRVPCARVSYSSPKRARLIALSLHHCVLPSMHTRLGSTSTVHLAYAAY